MKNSRTNTMKNANINTKNFYSINVNNIPVGAKVTVLVDGKEMSMDDFMINDPIAEMIEENGYVRNTKLHRRWIAAQTFRMLNYEGKSGKGWDAALKDMYDYNYQFKQITEEMRVIGILEKQDKNCFEERVTYFNKDVLILLLKDYIHKVNEYHKTYVQKRTYTYKGKIVTPTYIGFISGYAIRTEDVYKTVIAPTNEAITDIEKAKSYKEVADIMQNFMKETYRNLPKDTAKCKFWKDAFKGSGAYFTLKNMVMFHNVVLCDSDKTAFVSKETAVDYLNMKRIQYAGEGWRMHQYLKLIIEVNSFDLVRSIRLHNK